VETINIVIVENEELEAIKIKDMLNKLGCKVCISPGKKAFQKIKKERPDLVIIDAQAQELLPDLEAALRLQNGYDVHVVLLQPDAEQDGQLSSKNAGSIAFLRKPVDSTSLKKIIDSIRRQKYRKDPGEKWLSTAMKNLGEAVIKLDADGKITYFNSVAQEFVPDLAKKAMGQDFARQVQIYDATTGRLIQNPFEYVLYHIKNATQTHLTHLLDRTGHKKYFELTALPLFDDRGKIEGMLLILNDVTEAIRQEGKFLSLQEKFKRYQEESLTGDFVATVEGSIYGCNSVFVRLLGFTSEEEIKRHKIYDFYPNKKSFQWQMQLLQKKQVSESYKSVWKNRSGKTIFVIEKLVGQFVNKKLKEIRGRLFDITDHVRIERQLHHAQKMESIGTMAGGIAHDFNNMLGSILGYASFMKTSLPDEHPFYKYLDAIEKSSTRASELTSRLLTFARDVSYESIPINLNNLVAEAISIIQSSMDSSIEITTMLDDDLPTVEADSGGLVQVIMNICLNAKDAMPDGGSLTIHTATEEIEKESDSIGTKNSMKYVVLSIKDSGTGMDHETMQKAFEPFYTTKANGRNSGLGLSTVYGIIKKMDGFIKVNSKVGQGTEFRIHLPASDKPEKEIQHEYETDVVGDEVILVIDDDSSVCALATDILQKFGYKVFLAENGSQAVDFFQKHWEETDLVILDMVMPKMGGEETFAQLKQMKQNVRVLLTSGYNFNDKMQGLLDQGAHGFLQKPYHFNTLLAKIRKILAENPEETFKTHPNKTIHHV